MNRAAQKWAAQFFNGREFLLKLQESMSTIGCILNKYKYIVVGMKWGETVVQPVEGLNLLRVGDLIFRHEAHHLTPGHLAHGPFLFVNQDSTSYGQSLMPPNS